MNNIKHILFDLDGTLTDSKEGITKSVQHALIRLKITPPSSDDLEWTIGPPLTDAFARLLNTKNQTVIQQAVSIYRERYEKFCAIENKPYEGIHQTLNTLKDLGYQIFLATSKPHVYAGKILEHFNLRNYFTEIHGSELDGTRDYKTELIHYILNRHQLQQSETIMIGDRFYDIEGAKNNALKSIGVTYGYGSLDELKTSNPDALCHHHQEIINILST